MLNRLYPAGVWAVDFEFTAPPGERPVPICMVAKELRSGRTIRLWQDQFGKAPPFPTGTDALFIAYYASAEFGCFLELGWPMPARILDLCAEFRNHTSGLKVLGGRGLLGALTYFGLDTIGAAKKDEMRAIAIRGGPFTDVERTVLPDYCESDVNALERLGSVMLPKIDLPRALLRGRYMAAAAAMERAGVPIDTEMLALLRENWDAIKDRLIAELDVHGVFEGRTFKADRWARWLEREGIAWPRLDNGRLTLDDDTFREMARAHPAVSPIHELRYSLAKLRLSDLAVGRDGRNRTILGAFKASSGRNQPSNSKFIFGPARWLRGLIKPPPGHGVAYVDWSTQEFAIAAALSGDRAMMAAYESGDPYLAFGKRIGAIPEGATKYSHPNERHLFKMCILGVGYGMGERTLAQRIKRPVIFARDLLRAHREAYPLFWRWSDANVDAAMLIGGLQTVFGWRVHAGPNANPRSLRNFPMQANAAEMMRIAACLATERGLEVCAPVHDAFLICAPIERLDEDIATMRAAMAEASRLVLDGFEVRTDVHVVSYPDRYMDARGVEMWGRVVKLITECGEERAA